MATIWRPGREAYLSSPFASLIVVDHVTREPAMLIMEVVRSASAVFLTRRHGWPGDALGIGRTVILAE
jgi:hypothetical protein